MKNQERNDAIHKLVMRRLDHLEKNMVSKSDVISAVFMAHIFVISVITGTVVCLKMLIGFG